MDNLLGHVRYIGRFDELPTEAELNDVALVGDCIYLWHDNWVEIEPLYKETLLDKMIKVVRKAKDSKLKRELEELIREEYEQLI